MKSLIIIEDEIIVAKSIEEILVAEGFKILGIAGNYKDAKLLLHTTKPQLILCDINIRSDRNGIQLMEEINHTYNIPFIFISAYHGKNIVEEALNSAPLNYITKPFSERQLLVSVNTAFLQIERIRPNAPTQKETLILQLVANGASTKEIAQELNLSFHTIESHRKNILKKYNVKNITQLVCLATAEGWINSVY